MKIPKEEAGLWNWGAGSQQKLRDSGGSTGPPPTGDEDARSERRSYRRPSNDRHKSSDHCERDREQRDRDREREREQPRDRDREREEKEPGGKREPRTSCSSNRERDRDRTAESVKKRSSKTMRFNPGPLTRNPYLNFMREFRKHNTGESIFDITKQGAKAWQNLPTKDKEEFATQARRVPLKSHRKKRRRRRFF